MRIISKRTIKEFVDSSTAYIDAHTPMSEWYHALSKEIFNTPQELKAVYRSASILKGGRVVFNIGGNKYRIVIAIDYTRQIGYIKFVGTHQQYDDIDADTV